MMTGSGRLGQMGEVVVIVDDHHRQPRLVRHAGSRVDQTVLGQAEEGLKELLGLERRTAFDDRYADPTSPAFRQVWTCRAGMTREVAGTDAARRLRSRKSTRR